MEEQIEIQRHYRNSQEKYIYYIIALCVSAIGFSIHITLNRKLSLSLIPIGLSVFSWSISIIYGFKFVEIMLSLLRVNNNYIEVINGNNPISGTDIQKIKIGVDVLMKEMDKGGSIANKYRKRQYRFFFLGMIFFIVWHILELYLKMD